MTKRRQQAGADTGQGRRHECANRIHLAPRRRVRPRGPAGAKEHQRRRNAGQRQPLQGAEQADPVGQPAGHDRPRREPKQIVGQGQRGERRAVDAAGERLATIAPAGPAVARGKEHGQPSRISCGGPGGNASAAARKHGAAKAISDRQFDALVGRLNNRSLIGPQTTMPTPQIARNSAASAAPPWPAAGHNSG
jgi:hypothetical protein